VIIVSGLRLQPGNKQILEYARLNTECDKNNLTCEMHAEANVKGPIISFHLTIYYVARDDGLILIYILIMLRETIA